MLTFSSQASPSPLSHPVRNRETGVEQRALYMYIAGASLSRKHTAGLISVIAVAFLTCKTVGWVHPQDECLDKQRKGKNNPIDFL